MEFKRFFVFWTQLKRKIRFSHLKFLHRDGTRQQWNCSARAFLALNIKMEIKEKKRFRVKQTFNFELIFILLANETENEYKLLAQWLCRCLDSAEEAKRKRTNKNEMKEQKGFAVVQPWLLASLKRFFFQLFCHAFTAFFLFAIFAYFLSSVYVYYFVCATLSYACISRARAYLCLSTKYKQIYSTRCARANGLNACATVEYIEFAVSI